MMVSIYPWWKISLHGAVWRLPGIAGIE